MRYQPLHSLDALERFVGVEALTSRAEVAERGRGLTIEVLERALTGAVPGWILSVNIERRDAQSSAVRADLAALLRGVDRVVILEITERQGSPSPAEVDHLRCCGALVALDDVTPVQLAAAVAARPDIIKVVLPDWLLGLPRGVEACHAHDIEVVVEHVETELDVQLARGSGAGMGQGFRWSPAVAATELAHRVAPDQTR